MAQQPNLQPLTASKFFHDGAASRHLVDGTIARGHLRLDTALYTGRKQPLSGGPYVPLEKQAPRDAEPADFARLDEIFVDEFPFPVTQKVLEHGRDRYMIYCTVCHDAIGTGKGKIVERGYTRPPSYHVEQLRQAPVGFLFAVITEGYGSMPSYEGQIPPRDRWAIVSYIRALQSSQHFSREDMTEAMRAEFAAAQTGEEKP